MCIWRQKVKILQGEVHNTGLCREELMHILNSTERNPSRLINTCYIVDMVTYITDALSSLISTTIS